MNRCQEVLIFLQHQQAITRRYPRQNPQLYSVGAQRSVILPVPGSDPHLLTSSSSCCFCFFFIKGLTFAIGRWTVPLWLVLWEVKSHKPFHPILPGYLGKTCHRASGAFPADVPLLSHQTSSQAPRSQEVQTDKTCQRRATKAMKEPRKLI